MNTSQKTALKLDKKNNFQILEIGTFLHLSSQVYLGNHKR